MAADSSDTVRDRLRRALPAAMRTRDAPAVAALRSALAAIDNAEAVPPAQTTNTVDAVDPTQSTDTARVADATSPSDPAWAAGSAGAIDPFTIPDRVGAGDAASAVVPSEAMDAEGAGKGGAPASGTEGGGSSGRPGSDADGVAIAGTVQGVGAAEVERRRLSREEMEAIVRAEVVERRTAADEYERLGRGDQAGRLRREAAVLSAYLDGAEDDAEHDPAGSTGSPEADGFH